MGHGARSNCSALLNALVPEKYVCLPSLNPRMQTSHKTLKNPPDHWCGVAGHHSTLNWRTNHRAGSKGTRNVKMKGFPDVENWRFWTKSEVLSNLSAALKKQHHQEHTEGIRFFWGGGPGWTSWGGGGGRNHTSAGILGSRSRRGVVDTSRTPLLAQVRRGDRPTWGPGHGPFCLNPIQAKPQIPFGLFFSPLK